MIQKTTQKHWMRSLTKIQTRNNLFIYENEKNIDK